MAKKRRGWGEGSLYQRADGYWVGQAEAGRCPGGHPKSDGTTCRGGERRRIRVVRRRIKDVIAELDTLKRRGAAGKGPTLDEYMAWYLGTVKVGTVSDGTLDDYRRWHKDRISPYLGHVKLRRLAANPTHVQLWMNTLETSGQGRRKGQTGMSPKARNAARTLLSGALKHAKGLKMIDDNPCDYVAGAETMRTDKSKNRAGERTLPLVAGAPGCSASI